MILGVSPWGSEWDAWTEKLGLAKSADETESADDENRKRKEIGHLMEPALMQYAAGKLGPLETDPQKVEWLHPSLPLGAHLDGFVLSSSEPVEAKNIYFNNPHFDAWGNEGSQDTAEDVVVQVHAQMMCLDHVQQVSQANIVANVGGDFRLYTIPRSQAICDAIAVAVEEFWDKVQRRIEPCGPRSLQRARALKRIAGKIVELDPELALIYKEAQELHSHASKHFDAVKANILAAMGDAEIGRMGNVGEFTAKLEKRGEYTVKASESRKLRLKLYKD
jgi:peptidyl-tRNA hydrolase